MVAVTVRDMFGGDCRLAVVCCLLLPAYGLHLPKCLRTLILQIGVEEIAGSGAWDMEAFEVLSVSVLIFLSESPARLLLRSTLLLAGFLFLRTVPPQVPTRCAQTCDMLSASISLLQTPMQPLLLSLRC